MASLLLGLQFAGPLQLPGILPLLGSRKSRTCVTELFQREFCWRCLLQLWSGDGLQRQDALCWAGLLRSGEALDALRSDLVLPRDAAPGTPFALLQIRNPKTRGHAAKHQAARIDPPDVVRLLDLAFGNLPRHRKLWPLSSGTLRRRLNVLQERFGLVEKGKPRFELSSLRPGGATWMLEATEAPDLVRRRGRWLSTKVMEIYLQEIEATTYLPSLQREQRGFLEDMALAFQSVLQQAEFFSSTGIPTKAWFYLFS